MAARVFGGGVKIEQKLTHSIFLSLQGTYTKKKVDATDIGFIPFKKLEIKEIKGSLVVNWIPFSTFSIGGGPSLDFIPSINKIRKNGSKEKITEGRRELGGTFFVSYFYKHFLLEVNYYNGFKVVKPSSPRENIIEPIKSFGISLSYIIKVFEKRKGKKSGHQRMRRI